MPPRFDISFFTLKQTEDCLKEYARCSGCLWTEEQTQEVDQLLDHWNVVYWEEKYTYSQGYRSYWK